LFRWEQAASENLSESCLRIKARDGVSISGGGLIWFFDNGTWSRDSIFQIGNFLASNYN